MTIKPTGGAPSAAEVERIVRQVVSNIGAGNLARKAVGLGQPQHGKLAGPLNSEWRSVPLVSGTSTYIIPHTLGSKPVSVTLKRVDHVSSTPPHIDATAIYPDQWTNNSCTVHVTALSGGLEGVAWFLIEGA